MKHNSECTDNGLRTLICPEEFPIKENLAGILQLPLLHYHTKMREILRNISTFYFIKLIGFQMITITFYANLNSKQFSKFIFAF
ncbi:hypothetical protein T4A_8728 [Trichinella pseudospiralis]|uniref:Uncharacterized protein n=1 Tax=Trichinella pseudospiralis TaxID=6337 RepID=A0A0V1E6V9_TRIPS|nr:hypothetical protein T4A_8728 [Trichinella pseudospiralis]